ncbi:hypothetical protein JG687_00015542 [Phytophthora cactorum]|uniref:BZIP domain-containing protein n=1 Tax=Phytophthora cactorum TaxID=29920 RepID=A0A8T1TYJ5_9STRA|nr:hypothetical protein JG687_00015542 [Phytophthora cactorum]
MYNCALRPPYSQYSSDDVIAGVVQRTRRSDGVGVVEGARQPQWYLQTREQEDMRSPITSFNQGRWDTTSSEGITPFYTVRDKKRTSQESQASYLFFVSQEHNTKLLAELIISEKARMRELRRVRQVRYRIKKDSYASSLEEETRSLRREVGKLELERHAVFSVAKTIDTAWLCGGVFPTAPLQLPRDPQGLDSALGEVHDVELELESLDRDNTEALVATTVTITEHTLRNVFPHLHDRSDVVMLKLAEKLQGQRISMHDTTRFLWDPAFRRIPSVIAQADMLTPMLRLLGSLENVSHVFEGALISPDFHLKISH